MIAVLLSGKGIAVLLSVREYDSSVAVNQERGLQCCCQSGNRSGCYQAQSVMCPNKMPGTILKQVQFPGAARDFFPRVNFQFTSTHWQCSYSPRVLSHASTSVCMLKPQTLAAMPMFGHPEILHTLIGISIKRGSYSCCSLGGGDSSVVRAPDSWLKGRGFESLLERRENFLLQGRLSVLTLISVSVPPPCYHSST